MHCPLGFTQQADIILQVRDDIWYYQSTMTTFEYYVGYITVETPGLLTALSDQADAVCNGGHVSMGKILGTPVSEPSTLGFEDLCPNVMLSCSFSKLTGSTSVSNESSQDNIFIFII